MSTELIPNVGADDLRGHVSLNRFAKQVREGRVQETMTTSDFAYMADLIDRGTKQGYLNDEVPVTYPILGRRQDSTTFEASKDYEINAAKLVPPVAEKGEYLVADPELTSYEFTMRKYGQQFDISWEAWLRDQRDLRLVADYPPSWGLAARYSMEYYFTAAWAANSTLFTAGATTNKWAGAQFTSTNADLSAANLAEAIAHIRSFSDPASNVAPYMGPLYLVVPPNLEFTARQIVASAKLKGDRNEPENNPMYGACTPVVNYFLPTIDTVQGTTAWYLFCSPRLRPAVRYGFLRGYEEPEIFVKDSDARALAGGAQDPFAGSFATDDIAFKLRFTFGTGLVDWRGAFMSTGAA